MSSGHQRIKWRRNIPENFNRLSRVHERYRETTDDRRQTDGRTTTYSEHEHEFTFAKKERTKKDGRRHPPPAARNKFIRRLTSCIPEYLDQVDERQTRAPELDDDAADTLHIILKSGSLITYDSNN